MSQNIVHRMYLRSLRTLGLNQRSWDSQFLARDNGYGPRSPNTLSRVQSLGRGGRLIEFGCGEGDLPFALAQGTYSSYMGYDISAVAIARARKKLLASGASNIEFMQGDMSHWDGHDRASLIVAEECLYYLSATDVEQFLLRCMRCMTLGGSMLVIDHSATKHAKTLNVCRRMCVVQRDETIAGRVFLTLSAKDETLR
jgi:cyclopropane fatty-acyl-phospholipid synthase-like methyltransferase